MAQAQKAMSKSTKLALTVAFGVTGIVFKVIVFGGPVWDVPLAAELFAWAGGIAVAVIVFFTAEDAKDTAQRGEAEAKAGRDEQEAARAEARASMSKRQRRRLEQAGK